MLLLNSGNRDLNAALNNSRIIGNLEVYRTDATLSLASYLSLAVYASFA